MILFSAFEVKATVRIYSEDVLDLSLSVADLATFPPKFSNDKAPHHPADCPRIYFSV